MESMKADYQLSHLKFDIIYLRDAGSSIVQIKQTCRRVFLRNQMIFLFLQLEGKNAYGNIYLNLCAEGCFS